MIHTAAQVLGLVIALCGAWLLGGTGAVMLLGGLVLAIVSVAVETGSRTPAEPGAHAVGGE
jgi:hypothetical protein